MKDKEKQIEEMASDMDYGCTKRDLYPEDAKEIAKALYLLGYRKLSEDSILLSKTDFDLILPPDSVVLSKEEYEELLKVNKADLAEQANYTRKETAEKILNIIDTEIEKGIEYCKDDYRGLLTARALIQLFYREQFGVEIKD